MRDQFGEMVASECPPSANKRVFNFPGSCATSNVERYDGGPLKVNSAQTRIYLDILLLYYKHLMLAIERAFQRTKVCLLKSH